MDPSFRALAEGATDLVLRFDDGVRLLFVNRTYERVSGRSGAQLLGCLPEELGLEPGQAAHVRAAVQRALAGDEARLRHPCTSADGVRRWFDSHFLPERGRDGAVRAVLCLSRDVSAEVAALEERSVSETHFRLLYEAAPVGFGRTTLDGRWLDANPRLCAMLGYTLDELRGMTSADVTAPGDPLLDAAAFADGGEDRQAVKRYVRRDGTILWASITVRLARDVGGRPLHLVGIVHDVSESVAAERALQVSEARFRALVEQSPLSTVVLDLEGHVVQGNAAFVRQWGVPVADVPASYSVLTDEQAVANGADVAFRRAREGEYVVLPPTRWVGRAVAGRDRARWVQNVYYPLTDADGAVAAVVCIQEDVTPRREAEAALRESEARLRAVFEHVPVGIAVADGAHGLVTNANAALARMLGYEPHELAQTHFREFTHTDDLARDEELLAEVEAGRRDHYTLEKRLVRRDGTLLWVHLTVATVRDEHGAPRYTVGMTKDITQRKLIEAELRRRERELASLTDNSPDVVTRYGPDLRIRFMSAAFERATGIPAEHAVGRRVSELGFTAELASVLEGGARRVFEDGAPSEAEFEHAGPDGVTRTWSAQVVPELDEQGCIESALAVTRDVTERTRTRRALRDSEERFRALVEHSSDLIAILEPDGHVRYASPAQRHLLGYEPHELPDFVAYDLVHPDDVENARRRLAAAPSPAEGVDEGGDRPVRVRRRDGTWRSFLVRVSDLRADPALRGIVVNARDVTEELRLQERLAQAQKMEALGQLAGGVAHDFNNILAAITSYGQLLLDELPPGGREAEDAAEIVRAATRGAAVTRQLLAFSRRQALETEVIELGAVVRDTARMLRPLLPSSITLRLPEPGDAHVRAARAQIEQIVLNLAVNARDAMPEGGVLDVRVGTRTRSDAAEALLVVSDTGVGMSAAVRARAFEPFFTTKPVGRGTGLGLATVYGLARQFGGTVEVESAPDAGTTFTVALPLAAPASAAPAANAASRLPRVPRTARLLLVEDEEQVRTSLVRALGRAGHTVLAAPDGQAALDLLRAGERVDLVLSDVAMPRLGGRELAAVLAREHPQVRVVLMSGYAELGGAAPSAAESAAFVEKPFEFTRLLQVVDELLA